MKSTIVDAEGTLRLGWWKGNERLKGDSFEVRLDQRETPKAGPITMLAGAFDVKSGVVLEGDLKLPTLKEPAPVGVYIECGPDQGAAILIGSGGVAELGKIRADGSGFTVEKQVDREMLFGHPTRFRLLLGRSLLEFYLDDVLIECYSLPAPATGRVGLFQGEGGEAIGGLKAWGSSTSKDSIGSSERPQSSLPIE
ncbi:MAG: hypothetical protein ABIP48_22410 [Planctomycetota bacterium]